MNSLIPSPATRFLTRTDYDKYQPGYPDAILPWLQQTIGLRKRFRIADIGSGTGIFTELLLKHGYRVKSIEPDAEMRTAAEKRLNVFSGFSSIGGTAEHTGIIHQNIDLVVAAQTFNQFKPLAAKKEFLRILKPSGHVLLIWNVLQNNSPFLAACHALKEKYAFGLKQTNPANLSTIEAFFRPASVITQSFHHEQLLNSEGLKGWLLSFATVPLRDDDPLYGAMMQELDQLFEQYAENSLVKMEYETKGYLSEMTGYQDKLPE